MSDLFGFEKLEIWQLSMHLSIEINRLSKTFPIDERFDLISQINRSSSSVPSNIAEGTSRFGSKDKARFIQYAFSSNMETMNHLIKSQRLGYINEEVLEDYRSKIREISNKINAYHKSIFNDKI
jgi:four helix bundle protein